MGMKARRTRKVTDGTIAAWAEKMKDGDKVPDVRVNVLRGAKKLGHFDFLPTRAAIEKKFGLGKFQLKVYRNMDGALAYATAQTIQIRKESR